MMYSSRYDMSILSTLVITGGAVAGTRFLFKPQWDELDLDNKFKKAGALVKKHFTDCRDEWVSMDKQTHELPMYFVLSLVVGLLLAFVVILVVAESLQLLGISWVYFTFALPYWFKKMFEVSDND